MNQEIDQRPLNSKLSSESAGFTDGNLNPDQTFRSRLQNFKVTHSFWYESLKFIALIIFVVIPFRTLVAQPFMVSGESMLPNFHNSDYLIVNQLSKHMNTFERYDVIVFKYPGDPSKYYIKRIIGLPNEKVILENGVVTVYGDNDTEGELIDSTYAQGESIGTSNITLGGEEYFVMGDNRENSSDSRSWGALPAENIVGTPFVRIFPIGDIGFLPGNISNVDQTELDTNQTNEVGPLAP